MTKHEKAKIKKLLESIKELDGVSIPYPTAKKLGDIFDELELYLYELKTVEK